MRERLLAGEELNNRSVQAEYGISNDHTVSDAATKLRANGYTVLKEKRVEKGPKGRGVVQTYWRVDASPTKSGSGSKTPKESISDQIRQRLLSGDTLTATQVAEEYGVSRSLLGVVVKGMRDEGHTIDSETIEGGHARFRLGITATVPTKPKQSKSKRMIYADLTRRFEAGERINAHTVMNDYGVESMRFLATYLNAQRKKGWIFTRASTQTDDGWRTNYRLKWATAKKKTPAWVSEAVSTDVDVKTSVDVATVVDPGDPEEAEFAQALEEFEGGLALYPQLGTYFRLTLLAEGDPDHCPHCGGDLGTPIIYGMRNGTKSLMLQERSQEKS